ncbi:hypothetical protein N7471_013516 [Penicillium samsonianum]|uniref:uncharacterized protein n=1 Tax=Penicillium samsonianum TaxID=1882272 RepID=UPI002546C869|nr:uncharacterized protein N7471_013516 [Penicillium samsonianum]KAJ6118896.1 hypothetical protein N7471_013516 [Penicillium samsonianum]
MAPWYILSPLLLSLVVRLVLERRVALALAENLLLIASIQYAELSWVKVVVIAAIFVASAFLQTQLEYLDSAQDTYSHAAPLQCAANSRISGCPAHTSRDQKRDLNYRTSREAQVPNVTGNSQAEKTFHGRAAMFPCDLRHLRRSGFKDNYHHSYLYVGYPVGLRACYSPLITVEPPYRPGFLLPIKKAWFSIRPEDHAFNGGANLSMTQKLEEFLLSEGEDPAEWPYAYLLTPPSVTWQLNNPLSFWYLYNTRRELTAMIVQLQTSYGERRLWLTRNCRMEAPRNGPYCFKGKFDKDLQVSPFTPIAASYVIDSSDPCAAPLDKLKIMVTLKKGRETVVNAVVNSTCPPLDAVSASLGSSLLFLVKWWWVPMCSVVVFRILFKAAKIYLTHNEKELNIQTRAEPTTNAIAKSARLSERALEKYFSMILSSIVQSQSRIKSVKYITSGEHCARTRVMYSHQQHSGEKAPHRPDEEASKEALELIVFKVNTPTFYSRFFHYKSPFAAMQSELLDEERTRTVWSSHPQELAALFPHDLADTWQELL